MEQNERKLLNLEFLAQDHTDEIKIMLEQRNQPSAFEDFGSFHFLKIRKITMSDASLSFHSDYFLMKDHTTYFYEREQMAFRELKNDYEQMLEMLNINFAGNQKIINAYSAEIEKLEDTLFKRSVPTYFMDIWFDLKKDLAKIENFYYQNAVVYKEFLGRSEKNFKQLTDEFKDIEDMIHFQVSNLVTLKARMDSLHHYYDSIKSDRSNKTLLALTLISGVFLPLNLIVGFFGMNTNGLFFKDYEQGTQYVLMILFSIIVLAMLGIPLIKLFDKYLLKYLLGRYDFYKSITSRINRIDDHLKLK